MRSTIAAVAVVITALSVAAVVPATAHATGASAYATAVLADAPVAYWRFDGSGSSETDASGNGLTATLASGVTRTAGPINDGASSSAITVDGPALGAAGLTGIPMGSAARTVEGWIKTTSTQRQIVACYGTAATAELFGVLVENGDEVEVYTGNNDLVFDGPTISDGAWHYIAVTLDAGNNVTVYVDGAEIGETALPTYPADTVASDQGFLIGDNFDHSYTFDGSLAELAVYASALTTGQVQEHYDAAQAPVSVPVSGLGYYHDNVLADAPVAYWRFDGSGSTVADASGNGLTATLASGVTRTTGPVDDGAEGSAVTQDGSAVGSAALAGIPMGNAARTVEAWIKTTSSDRQIIACYGTASTAELFGVLVQNDDQVLVYTGNNDLTFTGPTLNDGKWHYIAVTMNAGGQVTVYVDGLPIGQQQLLIAPSTTASDQGFLIGDNFDHSYTFDGSLAELAVYPSALTASTVARHYFASGDPADLIEDMAADDWPVSTSGDGSVPGLDAPLDPDGNPNPGTFTGNALADVYLATYFSIFGALHAEAVFLTAEAAQMLYPDYVASADLGASRAVLDTGSPAATETPYLLAPGTGPSGGRARPDLVMADAASNIQRVYEIKFDSLWGRASGPPQLLGYINAIRSQTAGDVSGGTPVETSVDSSIVDGLNLLVYPAEVDGDPVPGLELYDVDGGRAAILTVIRSVVASTELTLTEQRAGALSEVVISAGGQAIYDGSEEMGTLYLAPDEETASDSYYYWLS